MEAIIENKLIYIEEIEYYKEQIRNADNNRVIVIDYEK
jgi:hypothetical protein